MRRVDRALTFPSRCAVIPFIGQTHDEGFIDTGSEIPSSATDSHVYVSVVAVREMAALIGWSSGEDVAALAARVQELEAQVVALEGEVAEADKLVKAIDALESEGFRARKKPGRPRKSEQDQEVVA